MRGPETIYTLRYTGSHHEGQWNRSKLYYAKAEYIRADIADARVAAAYERAANIVERAGHSLHVELRALTPNDAKAAMEAVRREARAEALREVRRIAYDAKDLCEAGQPLIALNLANQILALTLRRPSNDRA